MEHPPRVAVIGLGYVGLPLAVAFARTLPTIGFDLQAARVDALRNGIDRNGETPAEDLRAPLMTFTSDKTSLAAADVFVIAVPTPVDRAKRPELGHLRAASRTVGEALRERARLRPDARSAIVIYESTVYPGCTEEVCVPIVAETSGLRAKVEFRVGYSPERINPGDPDHGLERVVKIVSGQDAATCDEIAALYGRVVKAGLHKASSIRVAEAAKVIENTQRDLNIALMNELAIIFHRMGIPTNEVLEAAGTKWNFLPFKPGLVGGHCIPEDPYYLTHKAEEIGYHPQLVLAGRRLNDQMGVYIAQETIRLMSKNGGKVAGARILVLGVAFKENVKDVRNTRVLDLVRELESYGARVDVHDPVVGEEAVAALGVRAISEPMGGGERYDAVVLAVPHRALVERAQEIPRLLAPGASVLIDIKGALRGRIDLSGLSVWSL